MSYEWSWGKSTSTGCDVKLGTKLLQRQCLGNFWQTGWSAYGLFQVHRYHLELNWIGQRIQRICWRSCGVEQSPYGCGLLTLPWQWTWPSSMANGMLSTLPRQQTWPSSMANGTLPTLPWQWTWSSSMANGTPPTLPWQWTWPSSMANGTPPTLLWQQTWPSSMANGTMLTLPWQQT